MHIPSSILAAGLITCLMGSVQCISANSHHSEPNLIRRRVGEVSTYSTIHPGGLSDYEVRSGDTHATAGDYVMHGLSQKIDLVTRTYGLRNSESFYWGISMPQNTLAQIHL